MEKKVITFGEIMLRLEKVNDDRLYRSLDKLLVHKPELESYLANRLGELFGLEYDSNSKIAQLAVVFDA